MSAATPNNIVKSFLNAGISLVYDNESKIYCRVSPECARYLLESLHIPESPETVEEEDDIEENDYVEQYQDLIWK
jgi:hypothetical protein